MGAIIIQPLQLSVAKRINLRRAQRQGRLNTTETETIDCRRLVSLVPLSVSAHEQVPSESLGKGRRKSSFQKQVAKKAHQLATRPQQAKVENADV